MPHSNCQLNLTGNNNLEKLNYFCKLNNLKLYLKIIGQWSNAIVMSIRIMSPRFDRTADRYVYDVALAKTKVFESTDVEGAREKLAGITLEELNVKDEQSLTNGF